MSPLIPSRSEVTISPVLAEEVEPDDIVLVRVAGRVYLHKVLAADADRVQIGNNRGGVNGWTSRSKIYGICTTVDGHARPRTSGKVRPTK